MNASFEKPCFDYIQTVENRLVSKDREDRLKDAELMKMFTSPRRGRKLENSSFPVVWDMPPIGKIPLREKLTEFVLLCEHQHENQSRYDFLKWLDSYWYDMGKSYNWKVEGLDFLKQYRERRQALEDQFDQTGESVSSSWFTRFTGEYTDHWLSEAAEAESLPYGPNAGTSSSSTGRGEHDSLEALQQLFDDFDLWTVHVEKLVTIIKTALHSTATPTLVEAPAPPVTKKAVSRTTKDDPPAMYSSFDDLFKDGKEIAPCLDALRKIDRKIISDTGDWIQKRDNKSILVEWIEVLELRGKIKTIGREKFVPLLEKKFPGLSLSKDGSIFRKKTGAKSYRLDFLALIKK